MVEVSSAGAGRNAAPPPWLVALLAVLVTMLIGGCELIRAVGAVGSAPPSILPGPVTTVSLGIYSGRPDPSWSLTEEESAELGRLLGSLPSVIGDPPEGGLGYHGFVLTSKHDGHANRTLVAYRGAVAELGSGTRTYLADAQRTVERFLLESGRSHLAASEVDAVENDLRGP
jgi:hypothetical protein